MENNNHSDRALRSALSAMDDELIARIPMPADMEQRVMQHIETKPVHSQYCMWYRRVAAIGAVAAMITGLAVVIAHQSEPPVIETPALHTAMAVESTKHTEPSTTAANATTKTAEPHFATSHPTALPQPVPADTTNCDMVAADEPCPSYDKAEATTCVLSEAERTALIIMARQHTRQTECLIIDAVLQQQAMQQLILEECATDSTERNRFISI